MQDLDAMQRSMVTADSPLAAQVYSLHSRILCWRASEGDAAAADDLRRISAPQITPQIAPGQDLCHQLHQCVVTVEDLSSFVLGDSTGGALSAECMKVLRAFYQAHLFANFCSLSASALASIRDDSADSLRIAVLALKLLSITLGTSVRSLPQEVRIQLRCMCWAMHQYCIMGPYARMSFA